MYFNINIFNISHRDSVCICNICIYIYIYIYIYMCVCVCVCVCVLCSTFLSISLAVSSILMVGLKTQPSTHFGMRGYSVCIWTPQSCTDLL